MQQPPGMLGKAFYSCMADWLHEVYRDVDHEADHESDMKEQS